MEHYFVLNWQANSCLFAKTLSARTGGNLFVIFAYAMICKHIPYGSDSAVPTCADASTYLDLFGGEVLGAPEHVALGDALAAELVNLDHASKCDEAHQGVGRQQAEGHLQGLFEGLEVLFFQTRVHHIQEDQRCRWSTLQCGRKGSKPLKQDVYMYLASCKCIL